MSLQLTDRWTTPKRMSTMRRKDREITDRAEIDAILHQAEVCRCAFSYQDIPYLIPLSFGYDGTSVYVHTASEGMKLSWMRSGRRVCIEVETYVRLKPSDQGACSWTMDYRSVIGTGFIEEITEEREQLYALDQIMKHYGCEQPRYSREALKHVLIWKISIEGLTGKQSVS
jgi:uncharacterized protein